MVTTPEVSAIRDADRIIGLLEANEREIQPSELIINRLRMDMIARGDMMSVEDVVEILGASLIGYIPDDEQVVVATNNGETLIEKESLAASAFRNISSRVAGNEVPFLDLQVKKSVFRRWFKK